MPSLQQPPEPLKRAFVIPVSWRALGFVALIWLLPWALFWWGTQQQSGAAPVTRASPPAESDSGAIEVQPGPWGDLETTTIVIEPPDDLLRLDAKPVNGVTWHFVDYDRNRLQQTLTEWDLTNEIGDYLNDETHWVFTPEGIDITVPKAVVLAIDPETRRRIYALLSRFSVNATHHAPFSFRAQTPDDWFGEGNGLTSQTRAMVEPLLYRRGESLLLSDLFLIFSDIKPAQQRLALLRCLARSHTQLARLRITPDSDIAAITAYWSMGQRQRDIEPLLRSLAKDPAGMTVDVIHLLPRLARRLLYTFPVPAAPGESLFRDCHWTSLNFNKAEIDDSYADLELVRAAYQTEYREVAGDPRFGDILILIAEDGTALHACIFIAGDLVFTKNGVGNFSPWILMKMPQMLDRYPADVPLEIMIRRRL